MQTNVLINENIWQGNNANLVGLTRLFLSKRLLVCPRANLILINCYIDAILRSGHVSFAWTVKSLPFASGELSGKPQRSGLRGLTCLGYPDTAVQRALRAATPGCHIGFHHHGIPSRLRTVWWCRLRNVRQDRYVWTSCNSIVPNLLVQCPVPGGCQFWPVWVWQQFGRRAERLGLGRWSFR